MGDLVGNFFCDGLVLFEHEERLKWDHDVLDSFIGVVHHSIDELDLQLIELVL